MPAEIKLAIAIYNPPQDREPELIPTWEGDERRCNHYGKDWSIHHFRFIQLSSLIPRSSITIGDEVIEGNGCPAPDGDCRQDVWVFYGMDDGVKCFILIGSQHGLFVHHPCRGRGSLCHAGEHICFDNHTMRSYMSVCYADLPADLQNVFRWTQEEQDIANPDMSFGEYR